MIIDFLVPGIPIPWPRPQARVIWLGPKKPIASIYEPNDPNFIAYKQAIANAAFLAMTNHACETLTTPVGIVVDFVFPRTKTLTWKKKAMPRVPYIDVPDLDNLEKVCLDAMTKIVWRDDRQVVACLKFKWYAAGDESPHTRIKICTTLYDFTIELRNFPYEVVSQNF